MSRLPPDAATALELARTATASGEAGHYIPESLPVLDVPKCGERSTGLLGEAFQKLPLLQVREAPCSARNAPAELQGPAHRARAAHAPASVNGASPPAHLADPSLAPRRPPLRPPARPPRRAARTLHSGSTGST
jgi:hypothetical protein